MICIYGLGNTKGISCDSVVCGFIGLNKCLSKCKVFFKGNKESIYKIVKCLFIFYCLISNAFFLGYKCNCTQEFGGKNCENKFGICFPTNPCEHGKCNETAGSYTCTCDKGYTGKNCSTNINECENITCSNKGICVDTPGSFFCNCSGTGYDGEFCQKDINECETGVHKCINGSCIDVLGDYHCSCNVGWEGEFFGFFLIISITCPKV